VADYRGPLAPLPPVGDGGLSPFDAPSERPDISQRAALELGRLLALENQAVAVGLLRLKRSLAHAARHADQIKAAEHVYPPRPPESPSVAAKAGRLLPVGLQQLLTPELADWAEGLLKLEGLPFRYLLPDESQLPKESIRSFAVDERWMTNLLLGALGVGGAWKLGDLAGDLPPGCEAALRVENGPVGEGERPFGTFPVLTGVVLRSQIVSGWPAMTIDACRNAERLVSRRLSPNILLVLFRGVIDEVHFRLPQETLHFDLAQAEPVPAAWLKDATTLEQLRSHAGLSTQEEVRFTL
jgi:hypothetical protein